MDSAKLPPLTVKVNKETRENNMNRLLPRIKSTFKNAKKKNLLTNCKGTGIIEPSDAEYNS